jgi:peptide/nickel transport system permease protein
MRKEKQEASNRKGGWLRKLGPVVSSPKAIIGLAMVSFWILVAAFGPLLMPYGPSEQDVDAVNEGPSWEHWLGTDDAGRDLLSRLVSGARQTLLLAPVSVLAALAIGSTLGLIGGYFGGVVDEVVMRVLDAFMAMPTILLYLIIIAALGPSAVNIVLAITIGSAPGIARMVRSLTLDIRTRDYVAAAQLRGEHPLYIMFVEILPNARGPIMVDAMLRVGYAVFAIGTLGYLGLGMPPPTPDWGSMVERAHSHIFTNPWGVLWPAAAISSFVVGLNLFADGWQEAKMRYQ